VRWRTPLSVLLEHSPGRPCCSRWLPRLGEHLTALVRSRTGDGLSRPALCGGAQRLFRNPCTGFAGKRVREQPRCQRQAKRVTNAMPFGSMWTTKTQSAPISRPISSRSSGRFHKAKATPDSSPPACSTGKSKGSQQANTHLPMRSPAAKRSHKSLPRPSSQIQIPQPSHNLNQANRLSREKLTS
jgi:hypothetical protein